MSLPVRDCCCALLIAASACATTSRSPIIVPPEAVREWAYSSDGLEAPGRYVIRMTDGHREWEVEFPDAVAGSEVRVPLKSGGHQLKLTGDRHGLTAADRELEESDRAQKSTPHAADPIYSMVDVPGGKNKGAAKKPLARKSSYLAGVAQIRELYDSRNFEIALIQLVDLEKEYPSDEKLLAMKGSIFRKLGKIKLAREAWERALALNPDNTIVASALREMADEDERSHATKKTESDND